MSSSLARICARIRLPLVAAALLGVVVGVIAQQVWVTIATFGLFIIAMAVYLRIGTLRAEPRLVRPPVVGRWVPVNSPGSKVPSHGVQAWGQTYAVDLIHVPAGDWTLELGWKPVSRPPADFVSFGQAVVASADGIVLRTYDRARDHRSRTSWPALLYLLLEASVRELTGPKRILGNYVVIDLADGTYAAVAHLRQGSVCVQPGQRVSAGQQVGECGNSGNSTEPHVHFQLMDHPQAALAAGLPFRFSETDTADGLPKNSQPFVAGAVSVQQG